MSAQDSEFSYHRNTTFVALLLGYMGYYLCRQNFSVAQGPMNQALGISLEDFGTIASTGTAAYAIGKVFAGPVTERLGAKTVFFLGLWGSAAACLLFALGHWFWGFLVAWVFGRALQSLGWVGLVEIVARWFPSRSHGTAMGGISISYQLGGAVAPVVAGSVLALGLGWQWVFVIPALMLAVLGALLFPFLHESPARVNQPELTERQLQDAAKAPSAPSEGMWQSTKALFAKPSFIAASGLALVLTLLREVFSLWLPTYFGNLGAAAHTAAFKSAVFPLLGVIGTLAAGWFSDRILGGRRSPVLLTFMAGLVASLALVVAGPTLAHSFGWDVEVLALAGVGLTGFFLLAPYSMVGGGVIALDLGGTERAGTAAGLLDGVGYMGAIAAGWGVAKLVVSAGWQVAFVVLLGLAIAGLLITLGFHFSQKTAH